jgi:hypothetical protein
VKPPLTQSRLVLHHSRGRRWEKTKSQRESVLFFFEKKRINQKFQAKKKERKLFLLSFWFGRKNGNESLRTSRHPSGPLLFWKEKVSREKLGNLSEL